MGGNWGWIEWFGNFNNLFDPWINHAELGFMIASVESHSGNIFLFSSDMGQQANGQPGSWFWTTSSQFPTLFSFFRNAFVFYFEGTTNPRQFVDLQTGEFFSY